MRILDYNLIQRNMRCDADFAYKYANSAEFYVQEIAGKTFGELEKEYDGIPGVFRTASLVILGSLVEFNEPNPCTGMIPSGSCFHFPYTVKALIWEYSKPGIDERIESIEKMLNGQKAETILSEKKKAERKMLTLAMEEYHGDIPKVAEDLGFPEHILLQKLVEHGISITQ